MGFVIETRGAKQCPTLLCDHCHRVIETASVGNYCWTRGDETSHTPPIWFVHRACMQPLEIKRGLLSSMPLEYWFWCVQGNLELDWEHMHDLAEDLSALA